MSQLPISAMITPTVAVIGRPNVGKSTLFNRLVGRRQAIVHDQPGITRDRILGAFALADGRQAQLIDTGGLVPDDDPLGLGEQVALAIAESDLLLLVVDGKDGLVTADERVWAEVRPRGKPTILVVNKGDTEQAREHFSEFYRLGIAPQVLLSAEHGRGISDLLQAMTERLPALGAAFSPELDLPSLAIVGRPNVGKSSLVNRLLGESRVLVSPQAGTTRDPIDTLLPWQGQTYRLIDTAGIRRRSQVTGAPEEIAVLFARRQMERAQVVALVLDAAQGVTSGDLAIAGEAWNLGRAVVVVCNKWDLLDEIRRERLDESWVRLEELLAKPPRVNLSAATGRHLDRLLPALVSTLERYRRTLPTSEVNRCFERAVARHPAPQHRGKPWKLFYATQVGVAPPTFMLFANRTLDRRESYRRYLENQLREEFDLAGIPVRLVIRQRARVQA